MSFCDFIITSFYRRCWDDLIAISDVSWFYYHKESKTKSLREFATLLANLTTVERRNFKKPKSFKFNTKLQDEDDVPEASTIVLWEYYRDIIFQYWLDDLTQYPFWAAKILVIAHPQEFGLDVIDEMFHMIRKTFKEQGFMSLFVGAIPYLSASMICNFNELSKASQLFFMDSLARVPKSLQSASSMMDLLGRGGRGGGGGDSHQSSGRDGPSGVGNNSNENNGSDHQIQSRTARAGSVTMREMEMSHGAPTFDPSAGFVTKDASIPKSSKAVAKTKKADDGLVSMKTLQRLVLAGLSHPFLVLSISMITTDTRTPLSVSQLGFWGHHWTVYHHMIKELGVYGLYRGLRTRFMLAAVPVSHIVFFCLSDSIVYRRILGQGGLLSVATEITGALEGAGGGGSGGGSDISSAGSALSLLNYALLTAVQIIPGFLAFCGMRSITSILFGSSTQRKVQIERRRQINEAFWKSILFSQRQQADTDSSSPPPSYVTSSNDVSSPADRHNR